MILPQHRDVTTLPGVNGTRWSKRRSQLASGPILLRRIGFGLCGSKDPREKLSSYLPDRPSRVPLLRCRMMPTESRVVLEVFTIRGERVAVLADRKFDAGQHLFAWHPERWPTGSIYCVCARKDNRYASHHSHALKR